MTISVLRLVVVGWIVVLLVRAARTAWRHRRLAVDVWRRISVRHVAGSVALLVVVLAVAGTLLVSLPWLGYGLGSLVGFEGNAVFAPLEEAAVRAGPAPAAGPDWLLIGLASAFLGLLALMLPWLAFVEEEVFRAGLERASPSQQVRAALWFGAAHLVMLVPLAAALAIAVAGYAYGHVYRRAHHRADGSGVPPSVARVFRATRRSAAAADAARAERAEREPPTGAASAADGADGMLGARGSGVALDRSPERRQAEATLASAVWHTTFNTLVITLVWASIVWSAW